MKNPAIARSARRLRLLVWAGAGLIVAIWLLAKFGPQVGPVRVETHTAALGAAGRAIVDLTLLLFVVALARLAQMLGAIESGPLFGPHVTRAFRGFAFWLFLATLFDVAAVPVLTVILAATAGSDRAALVFELRDLLMLAGALFLFLLARRLEQARTIEAAREEIV